MKLPKFRNGIGLLLVMIALGLSHATSVPWLVPMFAASWGGMTIWSAPRPVRVPTPVVLAIKKVRRA